MIVCLSEKRPLFLRLGGAKVLGDFIILQKVLVNLFLVFIRVRWVSKMLCDMLHLPIGDIFLKDQTGKLSVNDRSQKVFYEFNLQMATYQGLRASFP